VSSANILSSSITYKDLAVGEPCFEFKFSSIFFFGVLAPPIFSDGLDSSPDIVLVFE
jgi:hypothetical protein